jgi:signal transduction histidine kinase
MLIASILMLIIAVLPFLLSIMIYRTLGNSKMSMGIIFLICLIGLWQLTVSFLFMGNYLEEGVIESLFRLLRAAQMFFAPTFLYIFYEFSKSSNTEFKVIKKWHLYVAFIWGIITYIINLTSYGVIELVKNDTGLYYPVYGIGNITYYIHFIMSIGIIFLAYKEIKIREHDLALENFMREFMFYALILLFLGALNFLEKVLLLAGALGVVVFTTLITFAILRYNFNVITKLNLLVRRSGKTTYANNLIANLIHELRNPLSAMQGYTEILPERQELNGEGKTIVEQLSLASDHMSNIVDGFVEFVKSGKLNFVLYDVSDCMSESLSLLKNRLDDKNVEVSFRYIRGSYKTFVDNSKLRQVFINLISNSLDAMDMSKISNNLEIIIKKNGLDEIEIDIKDNGTGMPEHIKNNLFTPTNTSKENGMGFGLVISRNVIMSHGGFLELVDTSENGTHFRILLPILYNDKQINNDNESGNNQ